MSFLTLRVLYLIAVSAGLSAGVTTFYSFLNDDYMCKIICSRHLNVIIYFICYYKGFVKPEQTIVYQLNLYRICLAVFE